MKIEYSFLKKVKIELLYDPEFRSGYVSKENESINSRRYIYPHVHSSIIYNSQDMGATQVSVNTHHTRTMEYYSAVKKE